MRQVVVSAFALLASLGACWAAPIEVGPFLQNVRTDGVTVVWETAAPSEGLVVVSTPAGERRFPSARGAHHEVHVSGLSPGRYHYHVESEGAVSADAELATAETGDHFTFLVYGDNRDRDSEHAEVIHAMAEEQADLLIQTGDMTGDASKEELWRRFFAIEAPLLASVPMYPAIGNHELLNDPLLVHFHRYFAPPELVPDHVDNERYYSFRYANALFVALDGNQSHSQVQADWLTHTLDEAAGDPAIAHVFVFFHQPPFSVGDFCGSAAEQGLWVPEFERRKVRAVFTGHDHSYQHLERNGVRYFVSGGGGAPLHRESPSCPAYDRHAIKLFRGVYHFLRVRVRGAEAVLDAIAADGSAIEHVVLHEPLPADATPAPPVPYQQLPRATQVASRQWLLAPAAAPVVALILAFAWWRARRNARQDSL
jgi:hypothetical protein